MPRSTHLLGLYLFIKLSLLFGSTLSNENYTDIGFGFHPPLTNITSQENATYIYKREPEFPESNISSVVDFSTLWIVNGELSNGSYFTSYKINNETGRKLVINGNTAPAEVHVRLRVNVESKESVSHSHTLLVQKDKPGDVLVDCNANLSAINCSFSDIFEYDAILGIKHLYNVAVYKGESDLIHKNLSEAGTFTLDVITDGEYTVSVTPVIQGSTGTKGQLEGNTTTVKVNVTTLRDDAVNKPDMGGISMIYTSISFSSMYVSPSVTFIESSTVESSFMTVVIIISVIVPISVVILVFLTGLLILMTRKVKCKKQAEDTVL